MAWWPEQAAKELADANKRIAVLETVLRDIAMQATQQATSASDPLLTIERLARNALSR